MLPKPARGADAITCTSAQAEILKYMHNAFGALMVVYSNLFADICAAAGVNWPETRMNAASEWLPDETLERYGAIWHDGHRGYDGACFPKDMRTLLAHCLEHNIDANLLLGLIEHNEQLRSKGPETWTPEHGER